MLLTNDPDQDRRDQRSLHEGKLEHRLVLALGIIAGTGLGMSLGGG